jgi:hypothetical protein
MVTARNTANVENGALTLWSSLWTRFHPLSAMAECRAEAPVDDAEVVRVRGGNLVVT